MESKLMKSELLYIEEHLSCQNYMTTIETGFKYLEFDKNTELQELSSVLPEGRFHHYLQPVPQQAVPCRRDGTHPPFFPAEGNRRNRFKPALHVFRHARKQL